MLYKTTTPLSTQIVSIVVSDLALTTLFDTIRRFGDSVAIAIFIYIIIKPAFAKKTRKNAKTGHLGDYFLFI